LETFSSALFRSPITSRAEGVLAVAWTKLPWMPLMAGMSRNPVAAKIATAATAAVMPPVTYEAKPISRKPPTSAA
jgi:hypothetical protein